MNVEIEFELSGVSTMRDAENRAVDTLTGLLARVPDRSRIRLNGEPELWTAGNMQPSTWRFTVGYNERRNGDA